MCSFSVHSPASVYLITKNRELLWCQLCRHLPVGCKTAYGATSDHKVGTITTLFPVSALRVSPHHLFSNLAWNLYRRQQNFPYQASLECLQIISTLIIYSFASTHDNVIKWKSFPRHWPFVRGIHRFPVNSPHKGQWRGTLMFSLICARINCWVNNREDGDLRRHHAHYDVIVMR